MNAGIEAAMRPEVEVRVGRFVRALQSSAHASDVIAAVVSGSASRGEEIWRDDQLISDIDIMLVTRRTDPRLTRALASLMHPHRQDGIDGGPTPLTSLRRYRTFAFYEARATGIVVYGNRDLAQLLPRFAPPDLPRWEAVRVLANRMFEHLKAACGQATQAQAAAKSYEALAEAALALEGRYRPSYKQRLNEITGHRPSLLSPLAHQMAVAVLRARLERGGFQNAPPDIACSELLSGLRDALRAYLQADGTLTELLVLLGQQEHHWRHRAYWAITQRDRYFLRIDPVIAIWQQAAAALAETPTASAAADLVHAWRACPQILRHSDPVCAAHIRGGLPSQRSTVR
jgi:hypothetical protein